MSDKPFFDTNVLLYLLSADTVKADCAEALIAKGGVISVQVLNEFASVAHRKSKMAYADIRDTLTTIRVLCGVQSLTVDTHEQGLDIAERYGFSLYDSMIVSAALQADCSILYSEDMQHIRVVNNELVIMDPFVLIQ